MPSLDDEYKAELEKLIAGATNNLTGKEAIEDDEEDVNSD